MKLLELLEDDGRDLVIIYPGRFHPFHIGHGKVYKYLKQKYSNAKVFISTSGKTDNEKSPFTFEEKKKMMMLAGVDSSAIVQCKSPYQSIEIVEMFDPDKTVVVFVVSEKDMENEPRFDFSNGVSFKKNGEPAHMQKWEGMESADTVRKHSYIATTPTFPFTIRGAEINSASQIRNMISKSDDTELSQILQDLYNVADIPQDVMDIFKRKIGNSTMNENWNEDLTSAFLIEDNTMSTSILKALTESGFSAKQIKMAFGILNDPRYKQGNYSGAVEAIEKVAKGLSEHPSVANALKRANEGFMAKVGQGIDNVAVGAGKLAKKGAKKAAPHIKKAAKDLGKAGADATKKGLKKLSKIGSKNTSYDMKTGKTNTTYGMANAKNESVAADIKDYIDDHKEHFDAYPMDVEVEDKVYDWDEYWSILDKVYPDEYPKFESVNESVDESDLEKLQNAYKHNEDRNAHSENIHMLAQAFGDRDEIKAIEGLLKITKQQGYVTPEQSKVMYNSIHKPYIKKLFPMGESQVKEDEQKERPYLCFHVKKGKHETHAPSSYDAAKNAAEHWGLKSTAGITVLADVEHVAEDNGYANDQHEMLEYIHHVLQECGDGNVDNAMVDQAIAFVEDIREQHFNADGSTKSESVNEDQRQADRYHNETLGLLIKKLHRIHDGIDNGYTTETIQQTLKLVMTELESLKLAFPNKAYESIDEMFSTRSLGLKGASKRSREKARSQVLAHGGNGEYKAVSSGGVVRIMHKGKEIASGDFDSGADGWFVSRDSDKGQKFFGNAQDMVDHFVEQKVDEWVQEPHEGQKWTGQERNFIQELCLRMDGISKSPNGLKWMGKSKTWDEGNVLSNKGKLTTVMIWAKRNKDDLYDRMGSDFKVYSDGNDEGQSDGNQIIQNIIGKIGSVEENKMHISPDIARAKTLQHTLPSLDREKYQERDGLEGPIMTKSGKVVYYDPKEGSYYDPDTDIYLSYEEWKELSETVDFFAETATMLAMNDGIMHYSDAKGTPKYSEGYKAAKDGVKYDENPYSGAEKLQWSKGHNDWRADELASKGEPNYGARGQFESVEESYSDDFQYSDDYSDDDDEIGASAEDLVDIIMHRIKMNKPLMLALLGDEGPGPLMNAVEDVADFYSGTTEVGSSDVSAMVDAVKRTLFPIDYHKFDSEPYGEAYNPETGLDPNVDTTEWDELIAKAKKKQEKEYANSKAGKRDPAYRHYHQYKTQ